MLAVVLLAQAAAGIGRKGCASGTSDNEPLTRPDGGGVVGELRDSMRGLPDAAQRRILGLNAVDLYGLPEPAVH